jgi:hypothetical protein
MIKLREFVVSAACDIMVKAKFRQWWMYFSYVLVNYIYDMDILGYWMVNRY